MSMENTLIQKSSTATGTGGADATVFPFANFGAQYFDWLDAALVVAAPSPAGTTPTFDGILQSSIDGTNWVTLATFTQSTTLAVTRLQKIFRLDPTINWGLFHRFQASVGSAAGNPVYAFSLYVVYGSGPIITTVLA